MNTNIVFINYPEMFKENLMFSGYSQIVVLADTNTVDLCFPLFSCFLPENCFKIVITADEQFKTLETCSSVWKQLLEIPSVDRNCLLINCGGGIVSDIGGFVASAFKRGIDYVNIPTTLLAMVDASIGGKTGVNLLSYKNQVGAFYDPVSVLVYPAFLKTLDPVQLLSGFGEILKYALISDSQFWNELINTKPILPNLKAEYLDKCIDFKTRVTKLDRKENGQRKILNFGHTAGHAIESLKMNNSGQSIPHGIAVAHGILIECLISNHIKLLNNSWLSGISDYVLNNFGKVVINESEINSILQFMRADKKNSGDSISFSLIDKPGNCLTDIQVNDDIILQCLKIYSNL